jgi:hypothetical protein
LIVPLESCSATDAIPSPPLARRVLVAAALAVEAVFLLPRLAAVAVPFAPERAVLAVLAAAVPADFAAVRAPPLRALRLVVTAPLAAELRVLVAADLAWVAARPPALEALVAVALVPLEAAAFVAREPLARLVAGLEEELALGVLDGARFAGGMHRLLIDFSRCLRAYPNCGDSVHGGQAMSSSSSAFCAWRRFSAWSQIR